MANQTMLKFGYPDSTIAENEKWVVLLRPKQVTPGCLVLVCKEDATSLGSISQEAGGELPKVVAKIERMLNESFSPDKFNYLALMMVDPHVHFHVIPRYSKEIEVSGTNVADSGWPKHPDMNAVAELTDDQMNSLLQELRSNWPSR